MPNLHKLFTIQRTPALFILVIVADEISGRKSFKYGVGSGKGSGGRGKNMRP